MIERNTGTSFKPEWIENVNINYPAVVRAANEFKGRRVLKKEHQAAWLVKAVTLIDLTTLAGDDTFANVHRFTLINTQILCCYYLFEYIICTLFVHYTCNVQVLVRQFVIPQISLNGFVDFFFFKLPTDLF